MLEAKLGLGLLRNGESREAALRIGLNRLVEVADRPGTVALSEDHVADHEGQIFRNRLAFVGGLELLVAFQGGVHGVLHNVAHGVVVERTHLIVIGSQERSDVGDDDTGFVIFSGIKKDFAEFEEGLRGLVWLGADLGEFFEFALVFLIELIFQGEVLCTEGGDFLGSIGFHLLLLHGDDVLFRQHGHVGGGGLLVEALAVGLGTKCSAHEEDFTELEICVIHECQVFFARDDPSQEILRLFEEFEAFVLIAAILGELVAALCGEGDGEKIFTAFNGRARGKFLDVFTQTGSGLIEVGDLVFAEGTAIDDGLEVG